MARAAESAESLLQTAHYELWHPEVEGRGQEAGRVTGSWEVRTQTAIDEIRHALCGCRLSPSALHPCSALQALLEGHDAQRVVRCTENFSIGLGENVIVKGLVEEGTEFAVHIFGSRLDDHARIAPLSTAVARAHTIDNDLPRSCGSGHYDTAGTHAETIDAAALCLRHKTIFRSGQPTTAALAAVVLNAVNERGGMFQANAHGDALCLHFNARSM